MHATVLVGKPGDSLELSTDERVNIKKDLTKQ
jgi:hypothetical protein